MQIISLGFICAGCHQPGSNKLKHPTLFLLPVFLLLPPKKIQKHQTKTRIKSLFNLMYDYALEYELVDRNYAHTFDISDDVMDKVEQNKHSHIIFTENEIKYYGKT